MSDLKWQSVEQLEKSKVDCEHRIKDLLKRIGKLQSISNGQLTRLEWINKYLFEKTPVELTMKQIEAKLGHRVILK